SGLRCQKWTKKCGKRAEKPLLGLVLTGPNTIISSGVSPLPNIPSSRAVALALSFSYNLTVMTPIGAIGIKIIKYPYMKNFLSVALLFMIVPMMAQEKSLFNGKDLTGWTIYGTEKWYVEDGLLVCESGPDKGYGYLATDKYYKDFELTLEFKQEADGNSGVFIRSTIDGTKVSGWQVEVAPPGHDTGGVYESYGRGWLIKPDPEKDKVLKEGEWNTMKIRLSGPTLTSWLNGTEMVTITDQKIGEGEGSIALQIHDGGGIKVKWRNIKVALPQ